MRSCETNWGPKLRDVDPHELDASIAAATSASQPPTAATSSQDGPVLGLPSSSPATTVALNPTSTGVEGKIAQPMSSQSPSSNDDDDATGDVKGPHRASFEPMVPHTERTMAGLQFARAEPTAAPEPDRITPEPVMPSTGISALNLGSDIAETSPDPTVTRSDNAVFENVGKPHKASFEPMVPHTERTMAGLEFARAELTLAPEPGRATPEPVMPSTGISLLDLGPDSTQLASDLTTPRTETTKVNLATTIPKPTAMPAGRAVKVERLAIQPSRSDSSSTSFEPDMCLEPTKCRKTPVPQSSIIREAMATTTSEHAAEALIGPRATVITTQTTSITQTPHTEITMSTLMTPTWHGNIMASATSTTPASLPPTTLITTTSNPHQNPDASATSGANTARNAEPSFASRSPACSVLDLGCSFADSGPQAIAMTSSDSSLSVLPSVTVLVSEIGESPVTLTTTYSWTAGGDGSNPIVTSGPQRGSAAADLEGKAGKVSRYGVFVAAMVVGFVAGVLVI